MSASGSPTPKIKRPRCKAKAKHGGRCANPVWNPRGVYHHTCWLHRNESIACWCGVCGAEV